MVEEAKRRFDWIRAGLQAGGKGINYRSKGERVAGSRSCGEQRRDIT